MCAYIFIFVWGEVWEGGEGGDIKPFTIGVCLPVLYCTCMERCGSGGMGKGYIEPYTVCVHCMCIFVPVHVR